MKKEYRIFGIRAIFEAIEAGQPVYKIFVQKSSKGKMLLELKKIGQEKNIAISYVPTEKLNYLSKGKKHQGVVADISPVDCVSMEELLLIAKEKNTPPLFVLLDGISDVRNFGAIIRTAECCGASGIIISKHGSAPITPDTVKTSSGAIFKIPICKVDHLKDAVFYLQQSDVKVYGVTEKSDRMVWDMNLKEASGIIVGSEEKGISPSILKMLDCSGKIPMIGKIESLNVSVACGMVLYEALHQRKCCDLT